uniref:Uncharacterized protein n=1 Tax=Arundo donax TaxID=35708 RepID=A0A0A9F6F6_ARUDO
MLAYCRNPQIWTLMPLRLALTASM